MADAMPVLEAVRQASEGVRDQMWGGAFSRFRQEIEAPAVREILVAPECQLPHIDTEAFPDPNTPRPRGPLWVEFTSDLTAVPTHEGLPVRTGAFIGRFESHGDYNVVPVRFAVLAGGEPLLAPGRVLVDASPFGGSPLDFADAERAFYGLQTTRTADYPELQSMNRCVVQAGSRYLRAIPSRGVPVLSRSVKPYGETRDEAGELTQDGATQLRSALATTCAEWWWPGGEFEAGSPQANIRQGLFANLVYRGPSVALRLFAFLNSPGPLHEVATTPAPPGRKHERTVIYWFGEKPQNLD